MYPTLIDRQPLSKRLEALSEALDLRISKLARSRGWSDYVLIGVPEDVSFASRCLREWGFQHVIADVYTSKAIKSVIVKWVWAPA